MKECIDRSARESGTDREAGIGRQGGREADRRPGLCCGGGNKRDPRPGGRRTEDGKAYRGLFRALWSPGRRRRKELKGGGVVVGGWRGSEGV